MRKTFGHSFLLSDPELSSRSSYLLTYPGKEYGVSSDPDGTGVGSQKYLRSLTTVVGTGTVGGVQTRHDNPESKR